jgi:hypothetical protein
VAHAPATGSEKPSFIGDATRRMIRDQPRHREGGARV